MGRDAPSGCESPRIRSGLLRDQVKLVKRKDSIRYEIVPIEGHLSLEKGFFIVIRACQLLALKNEGIILVGIAGPSGAGKTVFTEKMLSFMPSVVVISMDNYNDASRIIDGNFDDPRLTDYDTLLENIHGLTAGKSVQVPIYDFKSSSRIGYRTIEVPSSRIVIIEGIYALNQKLQPLLDLCVSVTGGVHFDLVKRVLRGIQRAGQEPEEIIHQISETSTRTVIEEQIKAVISEDLKENREETYDIYLLPPGEDPEACQSYLRMRNRDGNYNLMFELSPVTDIHLQLRKFCLEGRRRHLNQLRSELVKPGEDLHEQEWVTDGPFIISPRITFEVSVRLLGGLMGLGYTIATILKRSSHVFSDDRIIVRIDWLEQLNRKYIQVQGRDRSYVKYIAEQLGIDGSFVPRTYIEQIQLEKLVNDVMALPDDLKTKLSMEDDVASSPKEAISRALANRRIKTPSSPTCNISHSFSSSREKQLSKLTKLAVEERSFNGFVPPSPARLPNQGVLSQLSEQISTLNERMDELTSRIEDLNSKFPRRTLSASQQNLSVQSEACNGFAPCRVMADLSNGTTAGGRLPHSSSSPQLAKDSQVMEEIMVISRGQQRSVHQLDSLSNLLREYLGERSHRERPDKNGIFFGALDSSLSVAVPLVVTLAAGSLGFIVYRGFALHLHK